MCLVLVDDIMHFKIIIIFYCLYCFYLCFSVLLLLLLPPMVDTCMLGEKHELMWGAHTRARTHTHRAPHFPRFL